MVDGDGLIVDERQLQSVDLEHPPALTGRTDPELGECTYDFYRCQRCQRLITAPQLARALAVQPDGTFRVCPCGGLKFSPTWPIWYEFLYPRVLTFAWQRIRHPLVIAREGPA